MKKFKYPLSIHCNNKQEADQIYLKLEALGYSTRYRTSYPFCEGSPWLLTDFSYEMGILGFNQNPINTVVHASNPDLVLALAAATEGDEFHEGEYLLKFDDRSVWSSRLNKSDPKGFVSQNDIVRVTKTQKDEVSDFTHLEVELKGFRYGHESLSFRKATKEEIIQHFNMNNKQDGCSVGRKITGYKPKLEFEAASRRVESYLQSGFSTNSIASETFRKLQVLDLWFDPIYETQKEIITLQYERGSFEIEVSEEGIFYRKEDKKLDYEQLKFAINPQTSVQVSGYTFNHNLTTVDSGCKKKVPVADWQKVLNAYERLKK